MELAYRDCNLCGTKSSYSCFDGGRVAAVNPRRPSIEADAEAVVASTRRLVHSRDDPVSVPCSSSRDTLTVDEHDRALAFWTHSHRADDVLRASSSPASMFTVKPTSRLVRVSRLSMSNSS